jgi:Ca2+/Na+ antiporter
MVVGLACIGLFILLGIVLSMGKGSFLIAGFNTMPKEEQDKYDKAALCKFTGKIMFALAFSMVFWVLYQALEIKFLLYIGLVLFFAFIVFLLIYTNTGNRFKTGGSSAEKKQRKASVNSSMIIGLISLLGAAIFLFVLVNGTKKETEVIIQGNQIVFKGQYGVTDNLKEITDIQLKDDIPAIGMKVNGAGLGEIMKGDFKVEGLGTCRLFVHSEKGPFIYMLVGGKYTIINFIDSAKTMAIYEELKKVIESDVKNSN